MVVRGVKLVRMARWWLSVSLCLQGYKETMRVMGRENGEIEGA